MKFKSFFHLTTQKLLVVEDYRIGGLSRLFQLLVIAFIIFDLLTKQMYFKTEIPSGYTTVWAESNELYSMQTSANQNKPSYCDNPNYNYIYSVPYWDYRNISCINMHYSEMYQKGENEIFYMTFFTENNIELGNCDIIESRNCMIQNQLDGNCFCQNMKNYFTVGSEKMNLAFDHIYSTTFATGGNIGLGDVVLVKTYIRKINDEKNYYIFEKGQNINLKIEDWLAIAGIELDETNGGTKNSEFGYGIREITPVKYRISGVEIILKVKYYNIEYISNEEDPICIIEVAPNFGWASKGSHITYLNYPDLVTNQSFFNNSTMNYVDRYRYGIKFKFIVSGLMGVFDWYALLSHLVSGIVLISTINNILALIVTYGCFKSSQKISKLRISKADLHKKKFKDNTNNNDNDIDNRRSSLQSTYQEIEANSELQGNDNKKFIKLKDLQNNFLSI